MGRRKAAGYSGYVPAAGCVAAGASVGEVKAALAEVFRSSDGLRAGGEPVPAPESAVDG